MHLLKFEKWVFLLVLFCSVILYVYEASAQDDASVIGSKSHVFRYVPENDQKEKPADPWFGKDKVQHFVASAFLTTAGYLTLNEPFDKSQNTSFIFGSSLSLGAGVSKELQDLNSQKGHASYKDLAADILGIGFAVLMIKVL